MLMPGELQELIKSGELKNKLLYSERSRRIYVSALLIAYAIVLIWIVVFKCNNNEALHIQENLQKTLWERFIYRLEPFVDLRYMIRAGEFVTLEFLAFLFNVVCFMPVSMLLSFFARDKWNILFAFLFSLSIEVFQLFSGFGGFDPTDMLLNTLGAFLGCVLIKPLRRRCSDSATNAILLAFIPIMIAWALVVVIRTIIHFPIGF